MMSKLLSNKNNLSKVLIFDDLVNSLVLEKTLEDCVFVLPTSRFVKQFKRKLVKSFYNKHQIPLGEVKVFTLENFSKLLINNKIIYNHTTNSKKQVISQSMRLLLFSLAIDSINNFKYFSFKKLKNKHEAIHQMANLISGLMSEGITLEKLREELVNASENKKSRLEDIIEIYKNYLELLKHNYNGNSGYFEQFQIYQELTKTNVSLGTFPENQSINLSSNNFVGIQKVIFFGFYEFTKPELDFVKSLFSISPELMIYMDIAESEDGESVIGPLFSELIDKKRELNSVGFIDYNIESTNELKYKYSSQIRKNLFLDKSININNINDFIKVENYPNKRNEIEGVVDKISELLSIGTKPEDICIVASNQAAYRQTIKTQFIKKNISLSLAERPKLNNSLIINEVIVLIEFLTGNVNAKVLHTLLDSKYVGFLKIEKDECQTLINCLKKYKLIYKKEVSFQFDTFSQNSLIIFSNLIDTKTEQIKSISDDNSDYQSKRSLEFEIKELRTSIEIIQKLNEIKNEFTINDLTSFNSLFKEILQSIDIKDIYELYSTNISFNDFDYFKKTIESEGRAIREFNRLVVELIDAYRMLNDKLPFNFTEFVSKLKLMTEKGRFQPRELPNQSILFTEIEQIRGSKYKHLFVVGMNDYLFPATFQTDVLLGFDMNNSEQRHYNSEKIQFYITLTNNSDLLNEGAQHIYYSYHTKNDRGDCSASPYVLELAKLSVLIPKDSTNSNEDFIQLKEDERIDLAMLKLSNKDIALSYNDLSNNHLSNVSTQVHSATSLDMLITQPNEYFLKYVLGYLEKDEDKTLINNLEFGNILHAALESTINFLVSQEISINKKVFIENLEAFTKIEIKKYKYNFIYVFGVDSIIESNLVDIFETITQNEIIYRGFKPDYNYKTSVTEHDFNSADIVLNDETNYTIKLKGKIDRIDEFEDNEGKLFVNLIDYKFNSNQPKFKSNNKDFSVQMPLYWQYLKQHYKTKPELLSALYYGLSNKIKSSSDLISKADLEAAAQIKFSQIKGSLENLQHGKFSV